VCLGFLLSLRIFCFSLSSDLCYLFQPEAKGGASGASPPEGYEEEGAVDPWVSEAQIAAPLSREEVEPRRAGEGQEMETPRPQALVETDLTPGAMPPPEDAALEGAARPAVAEPLKCLGPPTPVIVLRTSDGDAGGPPTLEVR